MLNTYLLDNAMSWVSSVKLRPSHMAADAFARWNISPSWCVFLIFQSSKICFPVTLLLVWFSCTYWCSLWLGFGCRTLIFFYLDIDFFAQISHYFSHYKYALFFFLVFLPFNSYLTLVRTVDGVLSLMWAFLILSFSLFLLIETIASQLILQHGPWPWSGLWQSSSPRLTSRILFLGSVLKFSFVCILFICIFL